MWTVKFFGNEKEVTDLICAILDSEEELLYHHAEIETPSGRAAMLPITSELYKELRDSKGRSEK